MSSSTKQTVLITGASTGIGFETAKALLQKGFEVYGICRSSPEPLLQFENFHHLSIDLTDEASLRKVVQNLPPLDHLINNAGRAYASPVTKGNTEEWDEMWNINVKALALLTHLGTSELLKGQGQIINISSMSGHRVPPSGGFYAATKFAIRAITEATRAELKQAGSQIRVSSISPGFVDTPLLETYFKNREDDLQKTKETMPMLSAADIAQQILNIIETPLHVEIGDISLKSSAQTV